MKTAFFLDREKHPYEGVVRPFINWAKELSKNGWEVHFLLLNCEKKLTEFIEGINEINYKISKNLKEIIDYINLVRPSIILTDDNFWRLRLLTRIKSKIQIKIGVYVQVLFGIHSIVDVFNLGYLSIKERILFKLVRFFPFSLLKAPYKKLLQNQDLIIANSQITATLLHILYGVETHGIIYPPVDTEIFKPQNIEKMNQVLLYLGSHAGDTDENLIRKICKILNDNDFKILVMGDETLKKRLSKEFRIHPISGLSDQELAKIYSECRLTICPQKWEQFGYVVAESIACGTPVLAFNIMGPKEIIEHTNFGLLANNRNEFVDYLMQVIKNNTTRLYQKKDIKTREIFSIEESTSELKSLLVK